MESNRHYGVSIYQLSFFFLLPRNARIGGRSTDPGCILFAYIGSWCPSRINSGGQVAFTRRESIIRQNALKPASNACSSSPFTSPVLRVFTEIWPCPFVSWLPWSWKLFLSEQKIPYLIPVIWSVYDERATRSSHHPNFDQLNSLAWYHWKNIHFQHDFKFRLIHITQCLFWVLSATADHVIVLHIWYARPTPSKISSLPRCYGGYITLLFARGTTLYIILLRPWTLLQPPINYNTPFLYIPSGDDSASGSLQPWNVVLFWGFLFLFLL